MMLSEPHMWSCVSVATPSRGGWRVLKPGQCWCQCNGSSLSLANSHGAEGFCRLCFLDCLPVPFKSNPLGGKITAEEGNFRLFLGVTLGPAHPLRDCVQAITAA